MSFEKVRECVKSLKEKWAAEVRLALLLLSSWTWWGFLIFTTNTNA